MVVNLLVIEVPTPLTAEMIAIAIPAAISAYSMAVAPDSSLTKRASRLVIGDSIKCLNVAVVFQLVHPERVGTEAKREINFEELHRS